MKKKLKKLSAVLSVILSVLMLLSVFPLTSFAAYPKEYNYSSGTQFVSEIAFTRAGYWGTTYMNGLKDRLSSAGYNPWDKDFNDGCGTNSDYIAGGWKYTTDISNALRDVKFWVADSGSVPQYYDLTVNGRSVRYYLVGGSYAPNSTSFSDGGVVDLNGGAGGKYIYAFITRDPAAGPPITYIKVNTNNADSGYWSCTSLQSSSTRIDLNSGAGGDDVFMHLTSTATGISSANLRAVYPTAADMVANKSKYTLDSSRAIETAFNNATPVIESLDTYAATTSTQTDINNLYSALNTAINNAETNLYFNAQNNGGTTTVKSTTVRIGTNSTAVVDVSGYTATKPNAQFLGWNTDKSATTGSTTTVTVGANTTLYAIFSMDVAAKFNYIDADGNIATETKESKIYNIASSTTITTPAVGDATYDGDALTFLGWRDDNIAAVALYTDSVNVQPGIVKTFRAVYSAPVSVTFDANGGESEAPDALSGIKYVNVNDTVTERGAAFVIPEDMLVKTGYGFLGWSDDKDATKAKYHPGEAITDITEDVVLYAVWSQDYYTVVFRNYDGTVLYETNVVYGEVPVYHGDTPEKQGTVSEKWVFDGWDKEIVAATGHDEYVATYYSAVADYLIQFVDTDGTVLYETMVDYLDVPVYAGETPVKAADVQYSYTFKGWNKEIVAVTGAEVYTAVYDAVLNSYTITFRNYDGEVLYETDAEYGSVPVYAGETPVKESDVQYNYTFAAWNTPVVAVDGAAEYVATYSTSLRSYDVKFVNHDGEVLQSNVLFYGTTPSYKGGIPQKADDVQYSYAFAGWDKEIAPITGETVYTAQFEGVLNRYVVTFYTEDGRNILESKFVYYGFAPSYTGKTPVKNSTAQYSYEFIGWTPEIERVDGVAEYYAVFKSTVNEYTVKFVNFDGTVLQEEVLAYGTDVSYNGETPVRENDAYIYEFSGWDKTVSSVTGDVTYTAQYKKVGQAITVKFIDEDGTLLQSKLYNTGDIPAYEGEAPVKAYDNGYHYIFSGWDKEVTAVTTNVTYKAVYKAVAHVYTSTEVEAPTCTEDGTLLNTCDCGYSYTLTDPATGHNYEYVIDGDNASKVCANCGDTIAVSKEEAEGELGTTTEPEDLCQYCGEYHYKYIFPDLGFISCLISRIFTFFAELFTGKTL